MPTKLRLSLILILILQANISFSQNIEFINGKLINIKSNDPIPFATIRIKNKAKGVISNADGGFKIPVLFQKIGDTLEISSIGYESKEILLSNLENDTVNVIKLFEKVEVLDEVLLKGGKKKELWSPVRIVSMAMSKIPENYPFAPFSYVGYYRDYQLKRGTYLNLNEAIMEVNDPGFGFNDYQETQTKLYSLKSNLDFPTDTIAARPYDYLNYNKTIPYATISAHGGNEYLILRLHDAIRNYDINTYDFVNRLKVDLVDNHHLTLLSDTYIDNTPLYTIGISRFDKNLQISGKIYISKVDFKIYKLEYAGYEIVRSGKRKKKLRSELYPNQLKPDQKIDRQLLYEVIVEYQFLDGKMYPNYISFNNSFEALQPPKFRTIDAKFDYNKKHLELVFNNAPLLKDALKKKNYKLKYGEAKLKIDSISVEDKKVMLYPEDKYILKDDKKTKLIRPDDRIHITVKVLNVSDIYGNVIFNQESFLYNQFREFFVQKVERNAVKASDKGSLYMNKSKPIFEDQPILAPKNLSDYWMNTPLKN